MPLYAYIGVVGFETVQAGGIGYGDFIRLYTLETSPYLASNIWLYIPGYSNIVGINQLVAYTNIIDVGVHSYRISIKLQ